jgi:predicted GIY-YIG superfamily endonuclease
VDVTLYVLRSLEQGRRYVGITKDLPRRLEEHRRRTSKGSQQLGSFELIHEEKFPSYVEARAREKFLKSGQGRRWLDERWGRGSGERR